jgi:hypothetical protein
MLTPPIITVGRTIRRMPAKKRVSYVNDDLRLFENGATISAQLPKVSPGTLCAGGGNADVLLLHLATYPALARKHCLDRRRREDQHCPIRGMPHPTAQSSQRKQGQHGGNQSPYAAGTAKAAGNGRHDTLHQECDPSGKSDQGLWPQRLPQARARVRALGIHVVLIKPPDSKTNRDASVPQVISRRSGSLPSYGLGEYFYEPLPPGRVRRLPRKVSLGLGI